MALTIWEMLSAGSLSAFTNSFTDMASVARARPVRETRETGGQDAGSLTAGSAAPRAPGQGQPGQSTPEQGTKLPRGSILDLSV